MEQRRGEIAAHPLAERQFPNGLVKVGLQSQDLVEDLHPFAVVGVRKAVDLLEQPEGLDDRDVPPQLGALAENDADRGDVTGPVPRGNEAVADDFAGRDETSGRWPSGRKPA